MILQKMHMKKKKTKTTSKRPLTRSYRSDVREESAQRTTELILNAVEARLLAGDWALSYAALAREARVSVPTVYRHFPTKTALYERFAEREGKRVGAIMSGPTTLEHLPAVTKEFCRQFIGRIPSHDKAERWEFSRAGTVPRRRKLLSALIDDELPDLDDANREIVLDCAIVLLSSAMGEAFRGYLQVDADQMATRMTFALEALFTHARTLVGDNSAPPARRST